jgi:FixJ family two-component response regulator
MSAKTRALISVVDDNESFCLAISSLLRANGLRVESFFSAQAFLKSAHLSVTACLVLDVRMPAMSGFELQRYLVGQNRKIPIIFMSASEDPQVRVEAARLGAICFLSKPFSEEELLCAIRTALPR